MWYGYAQMQCFSGIFLQDTIIMFQVYTWIREFNPIN